MSNYNILRDIELPTYILGENEKLLEPSDQVENNVEEGNDLGNPMTFKNDITSQFDQRGSYTKLPRWS